MHRSDTHVHFANTSTRLQTVCDESAERPNLAVPWAKHSLVRDMLECYLDKVRLTDVV